MAIAFDSSGATKLTAAATSATVDITTAAAGAWVYCLVAIGANETSTTFTGWTLVSSLEANESTATHYALYRRQKIAGDTTFTVSWSATSTRATIGWASYTGADPATPDELAAVTLHTTGTSFASPSLTPTAANRWALFCCYTRSTTLATDLPDGSAWTPDTSIPLTERLDASNSASASNPWVSLEFADSGGAVTQAAHQGTATSATAETHGAAFLLYLIPAAAVTAAAPPHPAPARQRAAARARLGARAALAAGILAAGIGPPAVPAPHQPPAVTHPAPHRAAWRSGRGSPPNAAQQVKAPVPVTVYARKLHGAAWRGGRGAAPAAQRQPFRPVTVFARAGHRALWRGIAGPVPAVTQALGAAQPFRPVTVYARKLHGAASRAGRGAAPAAAPQPFRPVTVYVRKAHGALWRAITGRPPAAARQPFRPVTVFARSRHGAVWRTGAGSPPAPPPPFTIGALTAGDKASGVLTATGASSALTATTAAQGTLAATDQRTGGPG